MAARLKPVPAFSGRDPGEAEAKVLGMLVNHLVVVRSRPCWIESAFSYQHAWLVDAKDA